MSIPFSECNLCRQIGTVVANCDHLRVVIPYPKFRRRDSSKSMTKDFCTCLEQIATGMGGYHSSHSAVPPFQSAFQVEARWTKNGNNPRCGDPDQSVSPASAGQQVEFGSG